MVIYKYPVVPGLFEVELSRNSRVLSVGVQNDKPMMWVLVDTLDKRIEKRKFIVIGTGHETDELRDCRFGFVGTFQLDGGALVFHLFESSRTEGDE